MRTIGQHPAESGFPGDLANGWSWEIAQLADGLLEVERHAVPFDPGCIGSVTVDPGIGERLPLWRTSNAV